MDEFKGRIASVAGNMAMVLVKGEAEPRAPMLCPAGAAAGDIAIVRKVAGEYFVIQVYGGGVLDGGDR